jgi:hypothetical protein
MYSKLGISLYLDAVIPSAALFYMQTVSDANAPVTQQSPVKMQLVRYLRANLIIFDQPHDEMAPRRSTLNQRIIMILCMRDCPLPATDVTVTCVFKFRSVTAVASWLHLIASE